jgi:phage tail-like protein
MEGENGKRVTAIRRDPLRTFQFRLRLDPPRPGGTPYIAGVRMVSGLAWSLSVHETWSGGNNYHRYANPDRITWEPITLEQGIALDSSLEEWADAARSFLCISLDPSVKSDLDPSVKRVPPPPSVKRELVIDVWNAGDPPEAAIRYTVHNAWVRKFVALPKLDAMTSEVAFHSVEVIHEGWSVGKG